MGREPTSRRHRSLCIALSQVKRATDHAIRKALAREGVQTSDKAKDDSSIGEYC